MVEHLGHESALLRLVVDRIVGGQKVMHELVGLARVDVSKIAAGRNVDRIERGFAAGEQENFRGVFGVLVILAGQNDLELVAEGRNDFDVVEAQHFHVQSTRVNRCF
ncbi:hypothetical protein [uncultured Hyphomicrobium sp.]|uniref:hypothetical protein n=1 Tax=uncultured Hyphomicrobium sp. TaxID=194373 RepID=UPI0025D2F7F8|nr:hypothetical protein [uncultured Hyphomicrobium sp.]